MWKCGNLAFSSEISKDQWKPFCGFHRSGIFHSRCSSSRLRGRRATLALGRTDPTDRRVAAPLVIEHYDNAVLEAFFATLKGELGERFASATASHR